MKNCIEFIIGGKYISIESDSEVSEYDGIKEAYVTLTPFMAKMILDSNFKNNRKINKDTVKQYAYLMRSNKWFAMDGGSIKISNNGELLDGQHRCAAIVEANIPVQVKIGFGYSNDDIPYFDMVKARAGKDVLAISLGVKDSYTVAAFEKLKILYNKYGLAKKIFEAKEIRLITPSEIKESYEPVDSEYIKEAGRINDFFMAGSKTAYALFRYITIGIDRELSDDFIEFIFNSDSKMTFLMVRALQKLRNTKKKITAEETFRLIVTLWNAWFDGVELKQQVRLTRGNIIMRGLHK